MLNSIYTMKYMSGFENKHRANINHLLMEVVESPFSREATISRLDLSDFSICILGYSQNRLISFDCMQNENVSLQFLIRWSKLNHIPHIKGFEIPVYKLTYS